jgi:glutathione S-transferase
MNGLKLYGGRSGTSLRCHWALAEAGVEYESAVLNMKEGEHKKEPFLKINPNGQIPALLDGDFALFESLAINHYIAEKFKPELLGTTLQDKALVLQWSVWSGVNLHHQLGNLVRYRWSGVKDENVMEEARKGLGRFMPVLEKALEGKKFLVGDKFSLAEINICAIMTYNAAGDFEMAPYKNVTAWMSAMLERPAFKAAKEEKKV